MKEAHGHILLSLTFAVLSEPLAVPVLLNQ
jgi:hypothetical protein